MKKYENSYDHFMHDLRVVLVMFFIWCCFDATFGPFFTDSTDAPGHHSGLKIYTDHLTGCEYLQAANLWPSGLTVRVDSNGKPLCGSEHK